MNHTARSCARRRPPRRACSPPSPSARQPKTKTSLRRVPGSPRMSQGRDPQPIAGARLGDGKPRQSNLARIDDAQPPDKANLGLF